MTISGKRGPKGESARGRRTRVVRNRPVANSFVTLDCPPYDAFSALLAGAPPLGEPDDGGEGAPVWTAPEFS